MRLRRPLSITVGQIATVLVALVIFAIATLGMYARISERIVS